MRLGSILVVPSADLPFPQGIPGLPEAIASGRPERCVALLRRHLAELQMSFEQNLTRTFSGHWRQKAKHSEISADRRDEGGSKVIKGGSRYVRSFSSNLCNIQASSISRIKQRTGIARCCVVYSSLQGVLLCSLQLCGCA